MSTITPQILLRAYSAGVFPMGESADDPALYWVEPDERGVFPLDGLIISRSLRKAVKQQRFEIRVNTAFSRVIQECASKTDQRAETWINARILSMYGQLHDMGFCHSVETWHEGQLVGGLYGVSIGAAFFGESMFSRMTDASKVALVHLVARLNFGGFHLLDAQFVNPHLSTLGVVPVKKKEFQVMLESALAESADFFRFSDDVDASRVLELAAGTRHT